MNKIIVENQEKKLYGSIEIPKHNTKNMVLFVHGILSGVEESQRFSYIRKVLHQSNIATCGFYLPSHGKRIKESFHIQQCIETIEQSLIYIQANYPDFKVTILGVSLGSSLVPLIDTNLLSKIETIILFSLIPDLTVFERFKFEQSHYKRWKNYGYSKEMARRLFSNLISDSKKLSLSSKIEENYHKISRPKFLIYGYNDRVTSYQEMQSFIDENTFFFTYNGPDSTHDLRGKSLKCACKQIVTWINC